jgi:hypothetical protein
MHPMSHPRAMRSAALVTALSLLLLLGSCGGGGGGVAGGATTLTTGGLVVQMHDHPIASTEPIDHVYVTIDGVEVARMVDGKEVRETVESTPGQYDLLELQHGIEAVIGGGSFPPGDYHWIRLDVARDTKHDIDHLPADQLNNYITVAGTPYPLVVPSGEQTGIKLGHHFTITAGVTTVLTLDFDVRKSVHRCGHHHVYRLKPRIRVVPTEVTGGGSSAGVNGSISTTDGSGLPSSTVISAQQNGVEVASVQPDPATNTYVFTGLADGTYDLVAIAPGYSFDTETGVVVTGGTAAATHDFSVAPAGVGAIAGTCTPTSDSITLQLFWNGFLVATVGAEAGVGDYVFDNVPAGDYTVVATDDTTAATSSSPAAVTAGSAATVDFSL